MWKIYAFLPNKELADDDTTPESQEELLKIIKKYMPKNDETIDLKELFKKVKNDESFDKKHFWRFNQNKLNQLVRKLN